jgi:hypothetical protein
MEPEWFWPLPDPTGLNDPFKRVIAVRGLPEKPEALPHRVLVLVGLYGGTHRDIDRGGVLFYLDGAGTLVGKVELPRAPTLLLPGNDPESVLYAQADHTLVMIRSGKLLWREAECTALRAHAPSANQLHPAIQALAPPAVGIRQFGRRILLVDETTMRALDALTGNELWEVTLPETLRISGTDTQPHTGITDFRHRVIPYQVETSVVLLRHRSPHKRGWTAFSLNRSRTDRWSRPDAWVDKVSLPRWSLTDGSVLPPLVLPNDSAVLHEGNVFSIDRETWRIRAHRRESTGASLWSIGLPQASTTNPYPFARCPTQLISSEFGMLVKDWHGGLLRLDTQNRSWTRIWHGHKQPGIDDYNFAIRKHSIVVEDALGGVLTYVFGREGSRRAIRKASVRHIGCGDWIIQRASGGRGNKAGIAFFTQQP